MVLISKIIIPLKKNSLILNDKIVTPFDFNFVEDKNILYNLNIPTKILPIVREGY